MSINYIPLKGNAGNVTFTLYDSSDISIASCIIKVFNFDEELENIGSNEIIENIQDDLISINNGRRQVVRFALVNSSTMGSDNKKYISWICRMINIIENNDDYRLSIQYRDGNSSVIYDAVFTGNLIKLEEMVKSGNIAQMVSLEFKGKTKSISIDLGDLEDSEMIATELVEDEEDARVIITELDYDGKKRVLVTETSMFSV